MLGFSSAIRVADPRHKVLRQARLDPDVYLVGRHGFVDATFACYFEETRCGLYYECRTEVKETFELLTPGQCKQQLSTLQLPSLEKLAMCFPQLYFSICFHWGVDNACNVANAVGCGRGWIDKKWTQCVLSD